uniref:Phosphodiesterase n=1 Tax=Cynoglossus semilaevis TaxID=244447 RepID=A0A3P8VHD6_CYNSE
MSATKTIVHFMVNERLERAEFSTDCSAAEVRDLFLAAAEVGPQHILKMYSQDGRLLNICPQLQANTEESFYRLDVVASDVHSFTMTPELDDVEERLQQLESRVMEDVGKPPDIICGLQSHVEVFRKKLEGVAHLSWMGLSKEQGQQRTPNISPNLTSLQLDVQEKHQHVFRKFLDMGSLQVSEEVRAHLKTPLFDNWQWEESEMLLLLQVMFTDLDILTAFHIQLQVLQNFLFQVYCHYNHIPFHNFHHCFCVTQMMYSLIWITDLRNKLNKMDQLIMLTSALCHDLDHPGYNNVYQINAQTDLARRYNDISPLENHHCAVAFRILSKPECNILKNVSSYEFQQIRAGIIKCILATDMARHNEILNKFRAIQATFDFNDKDHKEVLMKIMVKVSDISNEARPIEVAELWLDCLLEEFFNQSDMEKVNGLPVTPFMDRDKVSKPSSQTGFISFLLLPLFTELTKLFPCLEVRPAISQFIPN